MNALDKIIAAVAPVAGAKRMQARLHIDKINKVRGYEGGSSGRRTDGWKTTGRDANAEIGSNLKVLRNRSRALRRDNPYATAAIESIIDNTVGYGIKPKFISTKKTIKKRAAELWAAHCETKAIDFDGIHNIYGLQALAMGAVAESGEVLVRRRWKKSPGMVLPFQLQVLESDFLDDQKDAFLEPGKIIIGGVQFSETGGREGYWLFEEHPGARIGRRTLVSKFVPASEILHVYRMDRPGQFRGVPWASPVILRVRNFDEVEDAYVEREKIAACFSVWITGVDSDETRKKALELTDRVEPGSINISPPNTAIEFGAPPGVNGYKDFASINLHAIAAGFQVPYEVLGDLSGVNFSSGRMGWQNYQRRIERWQWQMFIPAFCDGVGRWFNDAAEISGAMLESVGLGWVPPRRMMVNPKEEIAALKDAIRNGFETWGDTLLALGYEPETQAESIKLFNDLLDKYDLKLDCDPRFAPPAGSAPPLDDGSNGDNGDQSATQKKKKETEEAA